MKFTKQILNESGMRKEKLFKQIESGLDGLEIVRVDDNEGHKFKIPATTTTAVVYDLILTDGSQIELYVMKDGTVGRVSFNGHAGGDKTIATVTSKKDTLGIKVSTLADEIVRAVKAENAKEQRAKINKRSMEKLLDEAEADGDNETLTKLKTDISKGSGKFIALNDKGEFHGADGWTSKKSEIKVFDTKDEAIQVENLNKVVQL